MGGISLGNGLEIDLLFGDGLWTKWSRSKSAAYDPTIQAASGMMAANGTRETGPMRVGSIVIDISSAITAAFAIAGSCSSANAPRRLYRSFDAGCRCIHGVTQSFTGYVWVRTDLMGSRSLSNNPVADTHPTQDGTLLLMPAIEAQTRRFGR